MAFTGAAHDEDGEAAATIAALGFPGPPHRVVGGRSPTWVAVVTALLVLLVVLWFGLLAGFLLLTPSGRALLDDTALSIGLGRIDPDATAVTGACEAHGVAGAGRYLLPYRSCPVELVSGPSVRSAEVTLLFVSSLPPPSSVGSVAGRAAARWPWPVLAGRWAFLMVPLALMGLAIAAAVPGWRGALQRSALRHGRVRPAALLTWSDRPWFAYRDDRGRRRFGRAARATVPLVLDGVRSQGAALVVRGHAVLIAADLAPLRLDAAAAGSIRGRVELVQVSARVRLPLPPAPGEPPTERARLARIEGEVARRRDPAERYVDAWRLVWDATDADVAERALMARDEAAGRLGPRRTLAALQACRAIADA